MGQCQLGRFNLNYLEPKLQKVRLSFNNRTFLIWQSELEIFNLNALKSQKAVSAGEVDLILLDFR